MTSPGMTGRALALAMTLSCAGCQRSADSEANKATETRQGNTKTPTAKAATSRPSDQAFRSLAPPPRQKGPARRESAAQLAAATKEAEDFVSSLQKSSYSRREIAAMADIRGYRLYHRRYFGQAHAWFMAACIADGRYELSLFNAARTAALTGRPKLARQLLQRLRALATPLARDRLGRAATDPDFAGLLTSVKPY